MSVFNTDFHFVINNENRIEDNCKEVIIDSGTWIGDHFWILKNTIFSKNTIIRANSVCSENYKEKYGDAILIAGVPAKLLKKDVSYLIDRKREQELFQYFQKNQNQNIIWKK